MDKTVLTLCALLAAAASSTNVAAAGAPSVGNPPAGQQLVVEPLGTLIDGAWTIGAPIPNLNGTSQTTTAADSNGNVYVIGGGTGVLPDVTLNTTWMYSPLDNTWTQMADVPTPLRGFGSVAILRTPLGGGGVSDQFFVFGGDNGSSPINTLNIYDVTSDTWSQGANIPPSGGGFGVAVCQVNGRIFLAGGSTSTTAAFEYDPASDSYTSIASLPFPGAFRTHGAGVDLLNECHTFANGLENVFHYIYSVDTNTWIVGQPMPVPVTDPAVVAVGTEIYVIGAPAGFVARTQIFNALDRTWSNGPDLPGPVNNTSGTLAIDTIYVEGGFDGSQSIPTNYSLYVGGQ